MIVRGPLRSRRWVLAGGLGAAGLLAAAGTAAAEYRDRNRPGRLEPAPVAATARVERTTLTEGQVFPGVIRYTEAPPLPGRLAGTLTWLPPEGTVLRPGDVAYRVDDVPVVLLTGATPAFRALVPGLSGPDVRQLEENLARFGYTGFTADRAYTANTAAAVSRWQQRIGAPRTGTVPLGHVIFTAGDVRVGRHTVRLGEQIGAGSPYEVTAGTRSVSFGMEPRYQRLAPVGGPATVLLSGGRQLGGTVAAVVRPTEADGRTTVTVTVPDQAALDGDEADVRLVAQERRDVLAVPVVALVVLDGGRYGVEVVGDGGAVTVVPVETGLFADGKVEIRGAGLAAGTVVSVPAG
ncbi:peptidoglycan-binding protein [Catenuloplanes indicus]|uniref:Peptidoglycan hydrolase-like protein with peptidoglycan-binding domain n=1 Tax=Catenuloplanes indicus TaxID=137267 RepID=A0AAE4B0Y2_9ACTN|nr:peptidoglycan-binding protein [Catenuloplanes indicus]MDQ0369106.1 peptidoglycan hydrolase-like protein with peptidoglycan-binding domain [Catenuloplanes indicus]